MMVQHHVQNLVGHAGGMPEDFVTERRMHLHRGYFSVVERSGLLQDIDRNFCLADVVQETGDGQFLGVMAIEPKAAAE